MIDFKNVSKRYPNGFLAVHDLTMHIQEGETLVLLGTSGSGKTTTMKMINRLIDHTEGQISIRGQDIMQQDVIALRLGIGYAIQNIGLFPHMTVAQNIGVVPQLLEWPSNKISERTDELLGLVGLPPEEFRDRFPSELSGGQRQRIGVARALAADPPIILMDEPFGALDPITREQLQDEFLDLETEIKKTIIFVTHDIFEAVKMGDRIALMDEGKLQQLDTPSGLVENPANTFVDRFLGQHRFQLSLLTRSIKGICDTSEEAVHTDIQDTLSLHPRDTLIEALDLFKKTKQARLSVRQGNKTFGLLRKKHLLETITDILGGMENDS